MSTIWEARYRSPCHLCGYTICPGSNVTWCDRTAVHAACLDRPAPVPPATAPCSVCHTIPATHGACNCEDQP
ncbi:hypothetical protein JOE61_000905 [Nocardioides salarius]|uniref:Uncharacterized protein n=1 Tax=Nocardioides salarius TaxID=374513 RepID=A0ABS2M7H3_9ACTN|nr:hypothetical protein [Nocardioides salarius]